VAGDGVGAVRAQERRALVLATTATETETTAASLVAAGAGERSMDDTLTLLLLRDGDTQRHINIDWVRCIMKTQT
jgi:hypothetical protein